MSYDFHRNLGSMARGQWFSVNWTHFYERPSGDPEIPEVWCYAGHQSYEPGDEVTLHVSTSAQSYELTIVRDGAKPQLVLHEAALEGQLQRTPQHAYRDGCDWPVSFRWRIPEDARSGGYVVTVSIDDGQGGRIEQHGFFIVRSAAEAAPMVLIAATSTWNAYNDWGGANSYEGIAGDNGNQFSPVLSTQRPWARGLIWLPQGAPRIPHAMSAAGDVPRYPNFEYAFAQGFSKYYAAAGWASYERQFVVWAEQAGFKIDLIAQSDLEHDPAILDRYAGAVIVGHDEYWSRPMRETVDSWVDKGGRLARFGGNYFWQVRLEDDGRTQVCYKYEARDRDPLAETDQAHLVTTLWEDATLNYPGAATMGLNGSAGVYVGLGGFMPRAQRGFTVYRPEHWSFSGSDLYFGDLLGHEAGIYGYEVDGCDFTFVEGRPEPSFEDGVPDTLQILAMGPAALVEEDHGHAGTSLYAGTADGEFIGAFKHGNHDQRALEKVRYGAGMIAIFQRGKGEVFNAASCEWVVGLTKNDAATMCVTRNVLERYSQPKP
ncbi:MAG: hypothetical protein JJ931_11820 [Henriciella sp.]|jgi:hypothetical protein|nr:hypothetical protein [Henriciella sp.]MBO6696096.1 hypothetical protein [Henriciella sp.]